MRAVGRGDSPPRRTADGDPGSIVGKVGNPRHPVDVAPTVDEQRVAGQVAGLVARQKDDDRCDVRLGVPEPTHRIGRIGEGRQLRVGLGHGGKRRGLGAGAHGVGHDAVRGPLPRRSPGERPQRLLGAVVLRRADMGVDAVERAEIHDVAATLGAHRREGALHRPEGPEVGELHTVPQELVGLVLDPAEGTSPPRVVDEDVDRTEAVPRLVNHPEHLVLDPHVHPATGRIHPVAVAELLGDANRGLLVDVGDHHVGSLAGEGATRRPPDAVSPSGHDRGSSLQASHSSVPFALGVARLVSWARRSSRARWTEGASRSPRSAASSPSGRGRCPSRRDAPASWRGEGPGG